MAIDAISVNEFGCAAIKAAAEDHFYGNTIKRYDVFNGDDGDHHSPPEEPDEIHIWTGTFGNQGELMLTVVHEAAHHLGYNEHQATYFEEACFS
jgi:hypothetical protein